MSSKDKVKVKEFNTIVDTCSDKLYRFALKITKDESSAHDVVQESFERMWVRRDDVEVEKAKAFLFKVAYNLMMDRKRKEKRESLVEDVPEVGSDDQYSDLKEVLHRALNTLPKHYKSVILLRDYEGYSYKEIGEITKMSEAQVKVTIYRARVQLKEYIGSVNVLI